MVTPYYTGEINILGFNDVSWWHGFLHNGQFFLSILIQPHIWSSEPFEAIVDSVVLIQDKHIVVVSSDGFLVPQISHVFNPPILYDIIDK